MVAIPPKPEQQVIDKIYYAIQDSKAQTELYLGRLGSSFIGEECLRKIWLEWRGYARARFDGRMLRLFETGHLQEDRIVEDLRRAGLTVWNKRDDDSQYEYIDKTGHFITKVDGIIKGVPESENTVHLLEIKTHNKNSFSGVVKKGVQEAKPTHYAQVQISMALSGMSRALYVSLCKDDEQFYIERVKEDKATQKTLRNKIIRLVEAKLRPAGISDDGESFGCKYCDMKEVCTGKTEPLRHCRTCRYVEVSDNGEWVCGGTGDELSLSLQRKGCGEYECL